MNELLTNPNPPIGLNILEYCDKLERFDLFTGKGFLNKNNFQKEEDEWILALYTIRNQNSN